QGATGNFGSLTSSTGIQYDVVAQPGVLDIIHVGNRNTVDFGAWAFDATADGDDIGIQPSWLAAANQNTVISGVSPTPTVSGATRIGILYQISSGGGDFDVTLRFSDQTSVTVTLNGPDWYGVSPGTPSPPGLGVEIQRNLGTNFTGTAGIDSARSDDVPLL